MMVKRTDPCVGGDRQDLSFNALTSLPPEIGRATGLQSLNLLANPLVSLPRAVLQAMQCMGMTNDSRCACHQWRCKG